MPIYAYRCQACGHAKDVLQKLSDPVLSVCPACGAEAFAKQVTAAGFQLKGSGWYVTDFRGGNKAEKTADKADDNKPDKGDGKPTESAKPAEAGSTTAAAGKSAAAPAPAPPSAAPAAAPAAGGS